MTLRTWHKSIGSLTRPVTKLLKTGLYTPTVDQLAVAPLQMPLQRTIVWRQYRPLS